MSRFITLVSILLLVAFSTFNVTFAQEKRARTLHDAVIGGDANEVKTMLSSGADINQKNRMGGTPLQTAIMKRQKDVALLLIASGAEVNNRDNGGQTALSEAVKFGDKEIIEQLIAKKVDINAITRGGENALSLAKKNGNTEIVDLLVKNGAKEPSLQDIEGEMYGNAYPGQQNQMQSQGPAAAAVPPPVAQLDMLKDPNEIKARVKTFPGLEKAVKDVNDKSDNETRQWEQTRYDNRTYLARAVQVQYEDEIALIRKSAVEENAKKTTAALDNILAVRKKRSDAVYRDLMEQKRDTRQTETAQTARGRTRGRTTGRETMGRNSQTGPYGTEGAGPYEGPDGAAAKRIKPEEQVDRETQEESRQWTQATPDKKEELAKAIHQMIMAEISSVRVIAEEEKAKKTVATIDAVLLARQERHDEYLIKAQVQQKILQQQAQDPRLAERNTGRYTPGAGTQQQTQQQDQRRASRGRRR